MEVRRNLLKGDELIKARAKLVKDLPLIGFKEFEPSNSWLEEKQIQKSLEERYDLHKQERIERESSLSIAVWISDLSKAKVIRQTGKIWETYGHHKDNEVWLFAEEALYLLETNDLELFYNNIRLSVERSYAILLNPSSGCSLKEYRTYSYLINNGFKVMRHSPDVTITRYENLINLDQRVTTQKRQISNNSANSDTVKEKKICLPQDDKPDPDDCLLEDNDEVIIIEEEIEVISVEDNSPIKENKHFHFEKNNVTSTMVDVLKNNNSVLNDDIGVISLDDDDDDDVVEVIENENCISSSSSSDSEDVVYVCSKQLEEKKQRKFLRINEFLQSDIDSDSSSEDFELNEEEDDASREEKVEKTDKLDLSDLTQNEILDSFPSAKQGHTVIYCPDLRLLPSNIVPKFSEYRVNLNIRQMNRLQNKQHFYRHNNKNFHNQVAQANSNSSLISKAQEMQLMALGLLQAASSLISNAQSSPPWQIQTNNHENAFLQISRNNLPFDGSLGNYPNKKFAISQGYNNFHQSSSNFSRKSTSFRYNNNFRNNFIQRRGSNMRRGYYSRRGNPFGHSSESQRSFNIQNLSTNTLWNQKNINDKTEVISIDSDEELTELKVPHEKTLLECIEKTEKESSSGSLIMEWDEKVLKEEEKENKGKSSTILVQPEIETLVEKSGDKLSKVEFISNEKPGTYKKEPSIKNKEVMDETSNSKNEEITDEEIVIQSSNENTREEGFDQEQGSQSHPNQSQSDLQLDTDSQVEMLTLNPTNISRLDSVSNWVEYKMFQDVDVIEKKENCNDAPLLKLSDSSNLESILSSIQVFEKFISPVTDFKRELKVSYDIFLPNVCFKKSMKMLPNFRVIIFGPEDEVPLPNELNRLLDLYQDEIPFLFSIVLEESLSIYQFKSVYIPVQVDKH